MKSLARWCTLINLALRRKTGGSLGLSGQTAQPHCQVSDPTERPRLRKQGGRHLKNEQRLTSGLHTHVHVQTSPIQHMHLTYGNMPTNIHFHHSR